MSKLIMYYSLSGKTKKFAEKTAAGEGAVLQEILETKTRGKFSAYFSGAFQAMGFKRTAIKPFEADLSAFDEIVIMGPIWAGRPAPAVNSAIDLLPEGKSVSLICTSGRGGYDLSKTAAFITARNCNIKETRCYGAIEL